jgi:GNAT superfamily N-acetyltransferase
MNREEIDLAADWAAAEGWNPGIHDADCFYAADPNGFLIGLLDGEPVAMVSAVAYEGSYGFMGFYIVKPEERHKGYGSLLVTEGLAYLGDRLVGIDSVRPDIVAHRFPIFKPAHVNYRFKWTKDAERPANGDVMDLSRVSFSALSAYDTEMFGFPRKSFLKCWISRPGTTALVVMKGRAIRGYGVIRECREGSKIGPLFAEHADCARTLFDGLTKDVKMGAAVFLDTPERNPEAVKIAETLGMTEVFRTTRMYHGPAPVLPLNKWFGVTSSELG